MADVKVLAPFILSWEGGFVNDPDDRGGATNKGVTMATYEAYCKKKGYPRPTLERLQNLSNDQWLEILKTMFWDRCKADGIASQDIANILVDWVWASGTWGIIHTQRILRVKDDGIVGPKTLAAINNASPKVLFARIWLYRKKHFELIAGCPGQAKFLRGWLRRLAGIKYGKLCLNK